MTLDPFRTELASLAAQLRRRPAPENGVLDAPRVVIAGMGGSAMAGEFATQRLSGRRATTWRDEALPEDLGSGDGVLCVSCSGSTAETLAAWREAGERGLARAAVASGGPLLDAARAAGTPACAIPGGLSPRASLGHLVRGVLATLGETGDEAGWREAADHVERVRARWTALREDEMVGLPTAPADELAWELHGRLAVIVAPGRRLHAAARRWAADLAENAKVPSVVWELPEASHNAVMALSSEAPGRLPVVPIVLEGSLRGAARVRWDALKALLREQGADVREIREPHPDPWIEALGLATIGGWVSVSMAEIEGLSAGSLSLMDELKRRLRPDPR